MKEHLQIIIVLTFLAAFTSCDQERSGISGESIITGVQNGEDWAAPASGRYNSGMDDTVKIAGWFLADENKAFTENIIFSNIPFQTGRYSLEGTDDDQVPSSHFSTLLGRDVPNGRFNLDTASGNFIEVEVADAESNYISGTFEAVYIRDPNDSNYDPYLPDTLRFTDGFFRVKIKDPR